MNFSLFRWKSALLVVVINIILWTLLFILPLSVPKTEQVHIFMVSEHVSEDFEARLKHLLAQFGVKVTQIEQVSASDRALVSLLYTRGILDCDLLILPESLIEGILLEDAFIPITEDLFAYLGLEIEVYTFFEFHQKKFGVLIHSQDNQINLLGGSVFFNQNQRENMYIFINKNSVNVGSFRDGNELVSDNALIALYFLLTQQND